jgi:hypothetical protein
MHDIWVELHYPVAAAEMLARNRSHEFQRPDPSF